MKIATLDDLPSILALNSTDPHYSSFSSEDLARLIVAPINLGQCAVWYGPPNNQLIAWITWAWLDFEAELSFKQRTRKLTAEDFVQVHDTDQLWIIDLLTQSAPSTNLRRLLNNIVDFLSETTEAKVAFHLRRNQDKSIRRIGKWSTRRKKK